MSRHSRQQQSVPYCESELARLHVVTISRKPEFPAAERREAQGHHTLVHEGVHPHPIAESDDGNENQIEQRARNQQ